MNAPHLVVGATFTARPLEKLLVEAGAGRVEFVPYNQLIQWLLAGPTLDQGQVLVILVRMADLVRNDSGPDEAVRPLLLDRAEALAAALRAYGAGHAGQPQMLVVPSTGERAGLCQTAELLFQKLDCVRHLTWKQDADDTPGRRMFDPVADRLGHIPFTLDGFKAVAGMIMAQSRALPSSEAATPAPAPGGLGSFLGKLRLRVACLPMHTPEQFASAAKLSHTAATFHATGRPYAVDELHSLIDDPDVLCLSVEVADRFGDYGITGFLIIAKGECPVVRDLVLSCVVLGKQVEHCIVHALAAGAERVGVRSLAFECSDRSGNDQVTSFLDTLCRKAGGTGSDGGGNRRLDMAVSALKAAVLEAAVCAEAVVSAKVELAQSCWGTVVDAT